MKMENPSLPRDLTTTIEISPLCLIKIFFFFFFSPYFHFMLFKFFHFFKHFMVLFFTFFITHDFVYMRVYMCLFMLSLCGQVSVCVCIHSFNLPINSSLLHLFIIQPKLDLDGLQLYEGSSCFNHTFGGSFILRFWALLSTLLHSLPPVIDKFSSSLLLLLSF